MKRSILERYKRFIFTSNGTYILSGFDIYISLKPKFSLCGVSLNQELNTVKTLRQKLAILIFWIVCVNQVGCVSS